MNIKVFASNRKEWRKWLEKNHSVVNEAWLVFYKKHTRKPTISYRESVEEAICFGWIDGLKKRIDDEKYAYRFTPRRSHSKWSPLNIELATKMIKENKMTDAGMIAFSNKRSYDEDFLKTRVTKGISLPSEIEKRLKEIPMAWGNYTKMPAGHKKQYILWLQSAKKPETRERRIKKTIAMLLKNEKPGM